MPDFGYDFESEYTTDWEFEKDLVALSGLTAERFWSDIRAILYKKVCRGVGGYGQWCYITGVKSKDKEGKRIVLSEKNRRILEDLVSYFDTSEGKESLCKLGILNSPDSVDELIDIIQNAKTQREVQADEFRTFFKHHEKVLSYLMRVL